MEILRYAQDDRLGRSDDRLGRSDDRLAGWDDRLGGWDDRLGCNAATVILKEQSD